MDQAIQLKRSVWQSHCYLFRCLLLWRGSLSALWKWYYLQFQEAEVARYVGFSLAIPARIALTLWGQQEYRNFPVVNMHKHTSSNSWHREQLHSTICLWWPNWSIVRKLWLKTLLVFRSSWALCTIHSLVSKASGSDCHFRVAVQQCPWVLHKSYYQCSQLVIGPRELFGRWGHIYAITFWWSVRVLLSQVSRMVSQAWWGGGVLIQQPLLSIAAMSKIRPRLWVCWDQGGLYRLLFNNLICPLLWSCITPKETKRC